MCVICREKTKVLEGQTTTYVSTSDNCVVIVKNVPCSVCEVCGEPFYDDAVVERLEQIIKKAKEMLQEISIIDYSRLVA